MEKLEIEVKDLEGEFTHMPINLEARRDSSYRGLELVEDGNYMSPTSIRYWM